MADTELDIPPYDPEDGKDDRLEKLLVKHLESPHRKHDPGNSTVNILFCFGFAIGGMGAFLTAYLVAFSPGATAAEIIIGAVLCGVGTLCWGVAWIGSMIENKV